MVLTALTSIIITFSDLFRSQTYVTKREKAELWAHRQYCRFPSRYLSDVCKLHIWSDVSAHYYMIPLDSDYELFAWNDNIPYYTYWPQEVWAMGATEEKTREAALCLLSVTRFSFAILRMIVSYCSADDEVHVYR